MFKLTEEMIKEIEEKVNTGLNDVNNGMKERLIAAGCYNEYSFFEVCSVIINIEDSKVAVIDPIKSCACDDEEEEEEEDCFW
jgi:hypothetical protein